MMMRRAGGKAPVVSAVLALFMVGLYGMAAEVEKPECRILRNLLAAVEANDYDAFLKDATAEVKAGLTRQMLQGVSDQLAAHMKKGFEVERLGRLRQQGCDVHLWKLTYRDGSDDTLVKLVLKDGQVAGFWLQ